MSSQRSSFALPEGYRALALRTETLPPADSTNCYVIGEQEAIVVDPGSPYRGERKRLERLLWRLLGTGGSLQAIVLTHAHSDHVGGAVALAKAFDLPVFAHPETIAALSWREDASVRLQAIERGASLAVEGERRLEVHLTPGHTPGHLCLFERRERALIAGDMIPGIGTTIIDPPEGNMAHYLESLRKLADLDPDWILPAHGPTLRPGRPAIEALIAHRLEREERVLAALRSGEGPLTALEVAARAYAEVSPLLLPLALRSTLAHLHKLRDEGIAVSDDDRWAPIAP